MAGPFRHRRPELVTGIVVRPDVQSTLARRFERRVTAVVAGAGFGKTTALATAFEENRLRPLGEDVWLSCEAADADPRHFAIGLAAAVGLDEAPDPEQLVEVVGEWIGGRAPGHVCIVLDDVHLVGDERGGTAALLAGLVESLPINGHLLLSGRGHPPVPLTRLELMGACEFVREEQLRLTDAMVAELLGVPESEAARTAGWPALVQLARHGGSTRYVAEEVTGRLHRDQLEVLTALVAIGDADGELLERVTGLQAGRVLDEIPLVHRRDGTWRAHDLWVEFLDLGDADALVLDAASVALDRGDPATAVDLIVDRVRGESRRASDLLERSLREALLDPELARRAAVRRWARRLRDTGPRSAARDFLAGMVVRLDNPGSEECHRLLRSAATKFRDAGDPDAAVAALGALCFAHHVRRDVDGLVDTFGELGVLADAGVESAQPYPALGAALVATAQGDSDAVVRLTGPLLDRELPTEARGVALWMHAHALCNLGHDAVGPARECSAMGLPIPGLAMVELNARLRAGLLADLHGELDDTNGVTVDSDRERFLLAAWRCVLAGVLDLGTEARRYLDEMERLVQDATLWQNVASISIPRAVVAIVEGRDEDAAEIVRRLVAATPREGAGQYYYTASIGLMYNLVPDLREWYHALDADGRLGPHHRRDLAVAKALVGVVDGRGAEALSGLELPASAGELLVALAARHGAMLLAACVECAHPGAEALVEDLVSILGERARARFRELDVEGTPDIVRAGARSVLESIPVAPTEPIEVTLLGGTDLLRNGVAVDHPDWRRERVRALLTFLSIRRDTTRESVIAALWPDADPASGRRNLRTTLNMLHDVLEPGRRGGDATFFVRSHGQRLRLVTGGLLGIDVEKFDTALDEAAALEERGVPSQSLDRYLDAVERYRGDLLPDSYDDWVVFARDRLRSRFVRGGVRAAELLVALGRSDEAIDVAVRMLAVEPWSEPAHRVLIAAHLEGGDAAAARRCLETCERVLADIGGPCEPETEVLVRRLAAR